MSGFPKLTELEIVIMGAMWDEGKDMTIQEIAERLKNRNLSAASVTQAMNRLLAKKVVEVKGFVAVANVYARTFQPSITRETFVQNEMRELSRDIFPNKKISNFSLIAALINEETEVPMSESELDELVALIDKKRK
jgi:predicted transcriptional regulator